MTIAAAFTLNACTIEGTGTTEITADDKESCNTLLLEFFDDALKNANVVVNYKSGDFEFTESIVGDKNCVEVKGSSKFYAFKQGDNYIAAVESDDSKYYTKSKDYYDMYYCYFINYPFSPVSLMKMMPEDGGTFKCTYVSESHDITIGENTTSQNSAILTYDYAGENVTVNIVAVAVNGLAQSVTCTAPTGTVTIEFSYGNATVDTPDITEWSENTAE